MKEGDSKPSVAIGNEAPGADLLAEANEVDGVVVTTENDALIESAEVPLRSNADLPSRLLPEPNESLSPTNSLQIPTSESQMLPGGNTTTGGNRNAPADPWKARAITQITQELDKKNFQDSQKSATPKKTESIVTVTIDLPAVNNGHSKQASKVPNLYVSGGIKSLTALK